MPRPRGENSTPTSVRLSPKLYDALDKAREGRSIGEEIRRRLEASFADNVAPAGGSPEPFREIFAALREAALMAVSSTVSDPDKLAYREFEAAAPYLLEALRPNDLEPEEEWLGHTVASSALHAIKRDDLAPKLRSIFKRRNGP